MKLLLESARRHFPDFNRRALSLEDFTSFCRRNRIKVHSIPLLVPGFFMLTGGRPHLYVDDGRRGVTWLHAALHELAHYLFHTPPYETAAYFYRLRPRTREEVEADAFAIIALIPQGLLKKLMESEDYAEDNGLPSELLKERAELFARYGI